MSPAWMTYFQHLCLVGSHMEHLPHGLSVSTERTHFGPPLGPMGPRRAFPIRPLRLVTDALGGPQALALADFWCLFAWGPPADTKRCLKESYINIQPSHCSSGKILGQKNFRKASMPFPQISPTELSSGHLAVAGFVGGLPVPSLLVFCSFQINCPHLNLCLSVCF